MPFLHICAGRSRHSLVKFRIKHFSFFTDGDEALLLEHVKEDFTRHLHTSEQIATSSFLGAVLNG